MTNKYELTDDTIIHEGFTLYRIRAITDFGDIKIGDYGGYVESKRNLSNSGNCWIYDNAKAYRGAMVIEDAKLYDNSQASGHSCICGDATLVDNAIAREFAYIDGRAIIGTDAIIINEDNDYYVGKKPLFLTYYKTPSDIRVCCNILNIPLQDFKQSFIANNKCKRSKLMYKNELNKALVELSKTE